MTVPATDLDHINGRADRLEDYVDDNLQPLCHTCHSIKTACEAGSFGRTGKARPKGCDVNGIPYDSEHHWNAKG